MNFEATTINSTRMKDMDFEEIMNGSIRLEDILVSTVVYRKIL